MRQRLATARALLADPRILVLDEPTTHLDPTTREAVLDDLLAAAANRSVLLVTHDLTGLDRFDEINVVVTAGWCSAAPTPSSPPARAGTGPRTAPVRA